MGNRTPPVFGLLLALVATCIAGRATAADVSPESEYGRRIKVYQTIQPVGETPFGEQISMYTGDLTFRQVDVSLEGKGPTITLARSLATKLADTEVNKPFSLGDWTLSIPRIETLVDGDDGWFVWGNDPYARCNAFDRPAYNTLTDGGWNGIEMITEDGTRQPLLPRSSVNTLKPVMYNQAGNLISFPIVTSQNWQVGCLANTSNGAVGEAFFVVSPNGMKYWFDYLVYNTANTVYENDPFGGIIRQRRRLATMYVSRIEDRFGNAITYDYGSDGQLDSISSSDGRRVELSWRTDYALVDHITVQPAAAHPRTWRYEYDSFSSVTDSRGVVFTKARLTGVVLPLNPDGTGNGRWSFDLHGLGGGAIPDPALRECYVRMKPSSAHGPVSTLTHPSGLVGTFEVATTYHARNYVPSGCYSQPPPADYDPHEDTPPLFVTASLVSKSFSGPGLPTRTWTFAYDTTPASTTSDPCAATSTCGTTKWVNVIDPAGDLSVYVFSNRWDAFEGKLLLARTYQGTSTLLRSEAYTYAASNRGPWPASIGGGLDDPRANSSKDTTWTPQSKKVITQQGATFTWEATAFDAYANPTVARRYSSLDPSFTRTETTTYFSSASMWLIGRVAGVSDTTVAGSPKALQATNYDPSTGLAASVEVNGHVKQVFTYNADGSMKSLADALGHTYSFANYERGISGRIEFPDGANYIAADVDDFSQIASLRDALGNTTTYEMDGVGRLKTTNAPGNWADTQMSFAPVGIGEFGISAGHWRVTTTKGTARHEIYLDASWQPILTRDYDTTIPSQSSWVARSYDSAGAESFVSYASSTAPLWTANGWTVGGAPMQGVRTERDPLGRPVRIIQDSELAAPLDKLPTSFAYLSGFRTQVTDPRSATTTTSYQAFDKPSTDSPIFVEMPLGATTQIVRDRFGKPMSLTRGGPGSVPVTRTYTYDDQQRLCRVDEPETGSAVSSFDDADRIVWSARGATISVAGCAFDEIADADKVTRTYDAMNRVRFIDYPSGTDDLEFAYDAAGNVTSAVSRGASPSKDIAWSYGQRNEIGLPTTETLNVDGYSYTLAYGYDTQGSLKTITYPDGRIVDFLPDALGRPRQAGSYAMNVSYFPDGALSYFRYGNGIEYLAQKNTRGLSKNLTYSSAAGALLFSQDLAYDENANLKSSTDLSSSAPSRTRTMDYDLLNRLKSAAAPGLWGTESYVYDALDNVQSITRDGVNNIFEYNALNRLTRISNAANGQTLHSYDYDAKGNVTLRDGVALTFDDASRMKAYAGKGAYRYDAWGRRVVRGNGAGTPQSYYAYTQAGQLLFEYDLGGNKLVDYVMLGGKLVAKVAADAPVPALTAPAVSTNGSYTVSWSTIAGSTGYILEESKDGGAWVQVQNGIATSWSATGKVQAVYAYRAKACFSYGCGSPSPSISVNVDLRPQSAPAVTVPGYIAGPDYTVSWSSVSGATSYETHEAGSSGVWGAVYTGAGTSVAITGRAGGNYGYRARGCNANGCGPWSASASTVVELAPTGMPSLSVPAQSFTGAFAVSWQATAGTTHYPLEQSFNGGAWSVVQDTAALTWSTSGKSAGAYAYRARSCNPAGCGPYSTTVTVTVTYPPATAPVVTSPASVVTSSYTVSWSVVPTTTTYTLQESINAGAWTTIATGATTSKAMTNQTDGSHAFRAQACNAAGCSAWSATASTQVQVTPSTPVNLNVVQEVDDSVRPPLINWYVSWSASPGATRYDLQIQNGTAAPSVVAVTGLDYEVEGRGTRTYWVRACKGTSNCSAWSAPQ